MRGLSFEQRVQLAREGQFGAVQPLPGSLVFLGDSITEGCLWNEWFPTARTVNRGIGGQTSADVRARATEGISDPRAVFILVGTNDVTHGRPTAQIAADISHTARTIRERYPSAVVVVQSVLPRSAAERATLIDLNTSVATLCTRNGFSFIDLWPAMATPEGTLKPEYTFDDLHLTGAGYQAWTTALRPLVDALTDA